MNMQCKGCGRKIETPKELKFTEYLIHYAKVGHDPSFIQGKYLETESGDFWHAECYFALNDTDNYDNKGVIDTLLDTIEKMKDEK